MFRKRLWAFQETLKPLEGHTERILKRAEEYCEVCTVRGVESLPKRNTLASFDGIFSPRSLWSTAVQAVEFLKIAPRGERYLLHTEVWYSRHAGGGVTAGGSRSLRPALAPLHACLVLWQHRYSTCTSLTLFFLARFVGGIQLAWYLNEPSY